ncbi:hypothetical protein H7J88_01570 [Mycolicibacterium flavescens]|uniref:Uncharacterized protein n=1 Tax=Mycolicibacterium flavescens TaxID=1776 RepID=A0A1E3RBC0_MYCFV|nr:hypothetical protein [Mycolicibacterium flavescens]MCV7278333.1 hypothetical protein [Mycolicibacterium flavescens]ODQ87174.1 hypothetical protein BHQ18_24750 [Mycolicibacterium flavescens]
MADRAKVEQSVFDYLKPRIKQYETEHAELTRDVARSIAKVSAEADDRVADRRRALTRAMEQLGSCEQQAAEAAERGESGGDCGGYRRQVQQCEAELQRALRGRAMIAEAAAQFRHAQSRYTTKMSEILLDGRKLLRTAAERSEGYQKASTYVPTTTLLSGTGSSGGGILFDSGPSAGMGFGSAATSAGVAATSAPASWRDRPGVEVPSWIPAGYALIPLSAIADDGGITSTAAFADNPNKHPVADLRWAVNALDDVVIPAMERKDDPLDYLERRDAAEGRSGARSYAQTYRGFFGDDAVALSPLPDGTFDVTNGYHRIFLRREAHFDYVPARIIGG